ncbi:MAG: hypothetical protein A3H96_24365 [Acidobacteria bacterium RIFCSPLOWO2_02_FULL_67_36]|nr:MAG: hypothetical protein A3H96_24365 [Acidobacteria bacterium RIFCSPLOWO2_02_FULL_67_36]OFW18986.1 MAG: hypothetical protein A3G21_04615 [Acidobacteria bacterium RIFCSPLOWO2_12_FULL_66_21]
MALRLGFDIDGVLADFRTAFRLAAEECFKREIDEAADPMPPSEIKRVWAHIARSSNWWMTLRPHEPQEIARLYSLSRAGHWEIFFITNRPASGGDAVQFQTQWWLEQQGFYLPSVLTCPGSRGDLANALRLDLVVDDQLVNCAEIVGASAAKAILMLRPDEHDEKLARTAVDRGIGVVSSLADTLPVLGRVHDLLSSRRGRLLRLSDWFFTKPHETLPDNPRTSRPLEQ